MAPLVVLGREFQLLVLIAEKGLATFGFYVVREFVNHPEELVLFGRSALYKLQFVSVDQLDVFACNLYFAFVQGVMMFFQHEVCSVILHSKQREVNGHLVGIVHSVANEHVRKFLVQAFQLHVTH